MNSTRRYAAFISYSHADARWAAWLQKQLESFRVPRRLVGTTGEHGTVPSRLAPVFRDREDLASANDLGGRVAQALEASDALLVVCSPSAARSRWVNEEIRSFRRLGRGGRIHCLLVPAEPGEGGDPGFPPALVEAIDGQDA
ncbi:MAG TPA: toll/interleukin-1 receptor domain-containing protein, partial [Arenimonas sp.]